jgi:hypothetical protein
MSSLRSGWLLLPTRVGTLERLLEAFNAHDLDELTSCFVDDYVLETCADRTRGGRVEGRDCVREGLLLDDR